MASAPRGDAEPTFEQHLAALEKVVADLEGDALSLEASIAKYQEGVSRLAACRRILDAAEQRLAELVQAPDGTLSEKPLAVGPDGLVDAPSDGRAGPASAPSSAPVAARAERVGTTAKDGGARAKRETPKPPAPASSADDDLPF